MLTTRLATAQDWPTLWPMNSEMGTHHHEDLVHSRVMQTLGDPRWAVIAAVDDERLVGYASIQDYGPHLRTGDDHRMARLRDVWVEPDERQRGVGRNQVAAATAWAKQRVRYLEWQAHGNRSAPFYERVGYHGDPRPQPDYPTFVIDFANPASEADR